MVPVFCPECWTFYKSSPLALFVAMDSSIQPNARVVKTCLYEELSVMHMHRSVQPERRSLQKHISGKEFFNFKLREVGGYVNGTTGFGNM